MKRRTMLLAALMLASSISFTGCHGIIPPSIGENAVEVAADTAETETAEAVDAEAGPDGGAEAAGPDGGAEAEGQEGENEAGPSADMSCGGESEPVVAPEMSGNIVYHFLHQEEKTTSLGALEQFVAEANLYDEVNADGINGVIHLTSGSSETYMTCVWTDNGDGTLSLQIDEFTTYYAKDVDGVLTIVSINYALGMNSSGTVDIPLAQ